MFHSAGRVLILVMAVLLMTPGATWALAGKPGKKAKRPPARPEQRDRDTARPERGELERFAEQLPPRAREAVKKLWQRMPEEMRGRVQERFRNMNPEQRRALLERFLNRGARAGNRPGRAPATGPGANLPEGLRQRLEQLSPEVRERVQAARRRAQEAAGRSAGTPERRMRPQPQDRPTPATPDAAGAPRARVLEERVTQVLRSELARLPADSLKRIQDALGHLPAEQRLPALGRALRMSAAGGRESQPTPDRQPKSDPAARAAGKADRNSAGSAKPQDRKPEQRKPAKKQPKSPKQPKKGKKTPKAKAPKAPKTPKQAAAEPRNHVAATPDAAPSAIERRLREGMSRLPESMRGQVEDRLRRVLPRLREGRGPRQQVPENRDELRRRFREALEREYQMRSTDERARILRWARTAGSL